MKISGNNSYNISARGIDTQSLLKVIPNTKVCKNLTPLDCAAMKTYCYSLKNRLGISADEIKDLFSKKGKDFLDSAYEFLIRTLKIDERIKPELCFPISSSDDQTVMSYASANNIILVNSTWENYKNTELFGFLRHELQHFKQQCDVLRCENLSEKAIEIYKNSAIQNEKNAMDFVFTTFKEEDYNALDKNNRELMLNLKSDKNAYNEYLQSLKDSLDEYYKNFKTVLLETMGEIKSGTKAAQKAEIYFKELCTPDYYNPDGTINVTNYIQTLIEQEALLIGDSATSEVLGECYFKKLKEQVIEASKTNLF